MSDKRALLSADVPLDDPAQDAFGYDIFAQHLAKALLGMTPTEGFVISVHAPWGYGKTTLLNFVRHYLASAPEEDRPIIVPFNPWWFAGSDDLVRGFFGQLEAEVDKRGKRFTELRGKIANFGDAVATVPLPYTRVGKFLAVARPKRRALTDLREDLEKHLRTLGKRIVVIVDDIDRLNGDETRQLFRVIKAIANLPNITYVLAYDQGRVAAALDETHAGSGSAFLQKIVQAPFDLPLPDKAQLRQLFFERLNTVLASVPEEAFDQVRWANMFVDGVEHFVNSPRAIVRVMNALLVTYPAVEGEVDVIDFIAIETIRVFAPALYEEIRARQDFFTEHAEFKSEARKAASESLGVLLNSVQVKDREALQAILRKLFPRVETMLGGSSYGHDWDGKWRKELRIASPEVFSVYFRLTVPQGQFRAAEMRTAVAMMGSEQEFADYLQKLATRTDSTGINLARVLLARLEDYTENDIPLSAVKPAVMALHRVGDDLLRAEPERTQMFDFGMDVQIARIVIQLMRRVPAESRFSVLEEAAKHAGIAILVDRVDSVAAQHEPGRDPAVLRDPLLSKDEAESLRAIALERIRNAAHDGTLESVPELPVVLARWKSWGKPDEMQAWLKPRLSDHAFVAALVKRFVQQTLSMGFGDRAVRRRDRISLKWVECIVDPQELLRAVEDTLLQPDAPNRVALQLYVDTATGKIKDTDDA
ncbi:MAG: P-loop NTPase fold protein [Gemmatimonadota bacterium]|nr:P-loop NTPase fold protein [Gemmatimonadota bacterium]